MPKSLCLWCTPKHINRAPRGDDALKDSPPPFCSSTSPLSSFIMDFKDPSEHMFYLLLVICALAPIEKTSHDHRAETKDLMDFCLRLVNKQAYLASRSISKMLPRFLSLIRSERHPSSIALQWGISRTLRLHFVVQRAHLASRSISKYTRAHFLMTLRILES